MKKLSCFLVAMLFLLMPALQSCDDNDGYSIGQFGGSWATVRVLSGNTYYLDSDYYGTLWPAASNVYGFRPVGCIQAGQTCIYASSREFSA